MGEMIEYARPDGKRAHGWLAKPAQEDGPGVVVLQEYWGLRAPKSNVPEIAERLAEAGFRALAPDLFHGKTANDAQSAGALMRQLDFAEAVSQDVRGAVQHLAVGGEKVGVVGFCLGGAIALLAAAKVPEVSAAVAFYGAPPEGAADLAQLRVPFLGHFANRDAWVSPATVDALAKKLAASSSCHEIHRYDAEHAFFNDKRPEVYDARAAELAWDRTLAFLARELH